MKFNIPNWENATQKITFRSDHYMYLKGLLPLAISIKFRESKDVLLYQSKDHNVLTHNEYSPPAMKLRVTTTLNTDNAAGHRPLPSEYAARRAQILPYCSLTLPCIHSQQHKYPFKHCHTQKHDRNSDTLLSHFSS